MSSNDCVIWQKHAPNNKNNKFCIAFSWDEKKISSYLIFGDNSRIVKSTTSSYSFKTVLGDTVINIDFN
jgi:hypothetical protein